MCVTEKTSPFPKNIFLKMSTFFYLLLFWNNAMFIEKLQVYPKSGFLVFFFLNNLLYHPWKLKQFPEIGPFFYIVTTEPSKLEINFYELLLFDPSFSIYPNVLYCKRIQVRFLVVHLVVKFLKHPLVWNRSSVFPSPFWYWHALTAQT